MVGGKPGLLFLTGLSICVAGCAAGTRPGPERTEAEVKREVKLWDVGEKNSFGNRFRNRNLWKQVPWGTTDHRFENDVVVESDFFFIYFSSRYSLGLHGKVDGEPRIWHNCLYRVYQDPKEFRLEERPGQSPRAHGRYYGYHGIKRIKITRNSPEEVALEHEGTKFSIPAVLRVFNDKSWVEVTPVAGHTPRATEQGIHGKVRMAVAPNEKGDDYVLDSMRAPRGRPKAPPCRMLLCLYESTTTPFMWVITWSSPFEEAAPHFINDSGPKGDTMWCSPGTRGGLTIPRSWAGSITSSWAKFGKKGSVVVGALTHWDNWYREHPDKPIKKGEIYTSEWKPPYPGRWRMTARVAERKYDQGFQYDGQTKFPARHFSRDVYDGKFVFESPIDGHLDYVIMYMYDRTEDTPREILTPMDQYRWTTRGNRQ